jgi:hypothetical protein
MFSKIAPRVQKCRNFQHVNEWADLLVLRKYRQLIKEAIKCKILQLACSK